MNLNVLKDSSEFIYYNSKEIPLYIKSGNLTSFTNMEALCHWHEDLEFLLPVKGNISYQVNDSTFLIKENNAIMVNARQMHYGFSPDQSDCDYLCIVFKPELLTSNSELINRYIVPVTEAHKLPQFLFDQADKNHKQIIDDLKLIFYQYQKQEPGFELEAVSRLTMIWRKLFILLTPFLGSTLADYDNELVVQKTMLSYIYQNYASKISLSDLAKSGGICRSTCCKLFKKYLNRSPNEFLTSYRLEESMKLLRTTNATMTEIALSCGFFSPSYFSETFLKYKGCTPREFRNKITL